ncbi:TPA: tail fiber protein [Escherichia coli]|nr:tail fiber protein [Escherichia coli]
MGADKTNNIMTLSSGVSQPLLADVQYFELYSSSALNRKLKNIVLPGFYCGFEPVPGTGLSVRITSENSEGKGAASVDVNNVQISVQQIEDVTVSVKAGATNIIVLEANFEHGVKTTQVDSASSVSAARIYARTDNTIGQNQIELCRVIVPSGATAVTKEMIVLKYRVNRAVGVEFSNEISSTEERKAATPLAVKTIHDLVDTKAPLDSPHLSGTPTSPTPEPGTNNTQIANAAFVYAAINALINGAPGTMDTLKEIAAAINNDPNFSTTINNALALKAPLASPALTGVPTAPTAAQGTNNTQIATTAYVRAAISALVGSSPEALDTLNELAAALGNDPNFATTMTNALAGKQPLDATLTALAALATGANKLPYFTGKDTVAQTDLTSVGRDILAKTSTLAVIQYLGLRELGTSGEKIPLLSTANTWSARQTFNGGIAGTLEGNADTATKLQTACTINGVSFDGSKNIELTAEDLNLQEFINKANNAVQRSGDILSGGLTFENDSILAWIRNTDWAKIGFKNDADGDTDSYMWFEAGDNGNEYFKWRSKQSTTTKDLMNLKWDALYVLVNAIVNGEVISKSANGLRIAYGNYGFFIRNDGSNTYFMLTNSGDNMGTYNGLRPLWINNATGAVSMGRGLNVSGETLSDRFAINSSNGMWIQMRDNNAIFGKNIVNTDSAQVLLRQNHADRKFMIGGLGNKQFGIYMINNSRTANGTDGQAYMDNNGNWLCGSQVIPGNYGNFDSRYVKDVRLGSQQYYGVNNWQTWNFQCPSGHVLSGINVQDTGSNSADNIAGVYYRPVQKYINGTWYNVASV